MYIASAYREGGGEGGREAPPFLNQGGPPWRGAGGEGRRVWALPKGASQRGPSQEGGPPWSAAVSKKGPLSLEKGPLESRPSFYPPPPHTLSRAARSLAGPVVLKPVNADLNSRPSSGTCKSGEAIRGEGG